MTVEIKKPLVKKIQNISKLDESDIIALHKDYTLHNANNLKQRNTNIDTTVDFDDLRGFLGYIKNYSMDNTALFVNSRRVQARFDYHNPNDRNFDKHIANFYLQPDARFTHWLTKQDKWFSQKEFSDFLDSGLNEVVNPAQSELIELIRNLRATTKHDIDFKQEAGFISVGYTATTKLESNGKKTIAIPEYFEIACLPYKGLTSINKHLKKEEKDLEIPSYQTKVKLGFRTSEEGSKLEFKYNVLAGEKLIEETQDAIKNLIVGKFKNLKVYIGG